MARRSKNNNNESQSYIKEVGENSLENEWLKLCFNAMKYAMKYSFGKNANTKNYYERNFIISMAYELGMKRASYSNDACMVGGEVGKCIYDEVFHQSDNDKVRNTMKGLGMEETCVFPDFIVHKSNDIESVSEENQIMIIEAKTKKNLTDKEFGRDFLKLNLYVDRLKFQEAVYLIVNQTPSQIDSHIKQYLDEGFYVSKKNSGKLWFMVQNDQQDDPVIYKYVSYYE